jgi:hypothetical protein
VYNAPLPLGLPSTLAERALFSVCLGRYHARFVLVRDRQGRHDLQSACFVLT